MYIISTVLKAPLNRLLPYIFIFWVILLLAIYPGREDIYASSPEIYYEEENVSEKLEPVTDDGHHMVAARPLAGVIGADLNWEASLETIDLERGDDLVRMMIDNPYVQSGDTTLRAGISPRLIDETGYVPLAEVVHSFGYLIERKVSSPGEETLYVYQPDAELREVSWSANQRRMILDLDEITPYRVSETGENGELLIEIDRASLADDFEDNASDRNFNVRVRELPQESRLELSITGPDELPYRRDGGVSEKDDNLVVDFLPRLVDVEWIEEDGLQISANDKIPQPEVRIFEEPRRLVIDIPDLMESDIDLDIAENDFVENVRISQFRHEPAVLRIVADLSEDVFLARSEEKSTENEIVFEPSEPVKLMEIEEREEGFNFVTSSEIEPEIFSLTDPGRIVVDLLNTLPYENFSEEIIGEESKIERIRSNVRGNNSIRLVADLEEESGYSWKSQPLGDGNYLHRINLENELRQINLEEQPGSLNFTVGISGQADFDVTRFENPDRLAIDIPGLETGEGQVDLPDKKGFVEDIRMGRFDRDGEEILRIVLEMSEYHGHRVISEDGTGQIMLSLERDVPDREEGLVVVDPGHGGFDSGAVADSGLTEKEVALDISRYMNELLQERGYDVIMTRTGDQFVSLSDRVNIANNTNATLFVSVHSNASTRQAARGMETYYAPGRENDSLYLAERLQSAFVDNTDLVDRGVKKDNFTVIRDTEMPAALLEIGFLSNPEDARKLEQDDFRKEAAEAAVEGIINFLNGSGSGVE